MNIIYEPRGKAGEYSPLAANIYSGCDHMCKYCYVKAMPYQKTVADDANPVPRKGLLAALEKDLKRNRINDQLFLCFTGDPYCRADVEHKTTRRVLELLLAYQVPTAILTKAGTRCLRDLDLFKRFEVLKVGATLTFTEEKDSRFWEPNAAPPADRLEALVQLHEAGVMTWASLEPVIDPGQTLEIIRDAHPFVDQFKLGKLNHHPLKDEINWRRFGLEAVTLLRDTGRPFYVKKDLQKFVPGLTAVESDMAALFLKRQSAGRGSRGSRAGEVQAELF